MAVLCSVIVTNEEVGYFDGEVAGEDAAEVRGFLLNIFLFAGREECGLLAEVAGKSLRGTS